MFNKIKAINQNVYYLKASPLSMRLLSSSSSSKKSPMIGKYNVVFNKSQQQQQQSSSSSSSSSLANGSNQDATQSFAERQFQNYLQGTAISSTTNDISVRYAPNSSSDIDEIGLYNSSHKDIVTYEQEIAKSFTRAKFLDVYGKTSEAINIIDNLVLPKIAQLVYFGTQHPIFADVLTIRGIYEIKLGRLVESFETLSIAVRIFGDTTTLRHRSAARALDNLGEVYIKIAQSPANAPFKNQISKDLLKHITEEKGLSLKEQAKTIQKDLDLLGGCGCCSCSTPTSYCAQLTCRWGKTFCLERTSCEACPSPAEAAHQAVSFEKVDKNQYNDLLKLEDGRSVNIQKLKIKQQDMIMKAKLNYLEAEKKIKNPSAIKSNSPSSSSSAIETKKMN